MPLNYPYKKKKKSPPPPPKKTKKKKNIKTKKKNNALSSFLPHIHPLPQHLISHPLLRPHHPGHTPILPPPGHGAVPVRAGDDVQAIEQGAVRVVSNPIRQHRVGAQRGEDAAGVAAERAPEAAVERGVGGVCAGAGAGARAADDRQGRRLGRVSAVEQDGPHQGPGHGRVEVALDADGDRQGAGPVRAGAGEVGHCGDRGWGRFGREGERGVRVRVRVRVYDGDGG